MPNNPNQKARKLVAVVVGGPRHLELIRSGAYKTHHLDGRIVYMERGDMDHHASLHEDAPEANCPTCGPPMGVCENINHGFGRHPRFADCINRNEGSNA